MSAWSRVKAVSKVLLAEAWFSIPILLYCGALVGLFWMTLRDVGSAEAVRWLAISIFAMWAGAGLKGCVYGSWGHLAAGAAMAGFCMLAALWLSTEASMNLRHGEVTGWQWVLGTFIVFFVFTPRRFSPLA